MHQAMQHETVQNLVSLHHLQLTLVTLVKNFATFTTDVATVFEAQGVHTCMPVPTAREVIPSEPARAQASLPQTAPLTLSPFTCTLYTHLYDHRYLHDFSTSILTKLLLAFFLDPNWTPAPDLQLFTDASGTLGFGGYWDGAWFSQVWPPHLLSMPIEWKELYATVITCEAWGHHWSGKRIMFHCDNQAIVQVLGVWPLMQHRPHASSAGSLLYRCSQ